MCILSGFPVIKDIPPKNTRSPTKTYGNFEFVILYHHPTLIKKKKRGQKRPCQIMTYPSHQIAGAVYERISGFGSGPCE